LFPTKTKLLLRRQTVVFVTETSSFGYPVKNSKCDGFFIEESFLSFKIKFYFYYSPTFAYGKHYVSLAAFVVQKSPNHIHPN
jgi:hypothetical protein